jgi:DNA-directed RNA polymerase
MRQKLKDMLLKRINKEIAVQNPLKFLHKADIELYLDHVISVVYLYTRAKKGSTSNTTYMAEIISAIGHGVRSKLKLKRDSGIAAKTGAFFLFSFEQLGMIQVTLGQGNKGHASYIVQVVNDDLICNLWNSLEPSQIEKLPSLEQYADWVHYKHPTGQLIVKTQNKAVLEAITTDTHPILFNVLNRAQRQGWKINEELYHLHLWALRNKSAAFNEIWNQTEKEARVTKLRETKAIGDIAKRFLDKTFYHLYYYDFRGRKYPTTAYLHEQGSDLAKALLKRADKKAIGAEGFKWLLIWIATTWGNDSGHESGLKTDKLPLIERFEWAKDNEDIFLDYAQNPKANQGWMQADKPWQFIAACLELKKLREWQYTTGDFDNYSYESSLEAYIDGSNNGSQHLSALTKDEITAPHVNLVPSKYPGDLYKYVSDHVWARLKQTVEDFSKEEIEACNVYIDTLIDLKKQINASQPKSEIRASLVEKLKDFKNRNYEVGIFAAPIFWLRIKDTKHKRKILKRNVMTIPYGGTAYGLGQQQIDDAQKHGIEILSYLEHRWASYLGREVFEDCKDSLKRPMKLLSLFEKAGEKAEKENRFLSWTVPITNFPVVQNYTEGVVKKLWIQYGTPQGPRLNTGYYKNTLQIAISFLEEVKPSKNKQSQGASPNAIHSLDACHLAITVDQADFSVTTVHDSFGCLLADMSYLFPLIRKTFVQLYATDPLSVIFSQIGANLGEVELGSLDINDVLKSEYCFS